MLSEVRNRTTTFKGSRSGIPGIIDSQSDVGGWPELRSGMTPTDTDQDGLPDVWETAHGLNPHDATDAALDRDADGYTELENF